MTKQSENDGVGRNTMQPETESQGKKPYVSPRLVVYGDLRLLTMSKGGTRGDATTGTKV